MQSRSDLVESAAPSGRAGYAADLALAFACLCWAGNFVVGRAVRDLIGPIDLSVWRWVVAVVVMMPFAAPGLWRHRRLILGRTPLLLALGLTGIAAFHTTLYLGLASTPALNTALLMALMPAVIALIDRIAFRARLNRNQLAGIALSILGAALVVLEGDPRNLARLSVEAGDLWVLVAVVMWSIYSVLLRSRPAELPPLVLLTALSLWGLTLMLPVYLAVGDGIAALPRTPAVFGAIAYVALIASVLATLAWNRGVLLVGPSRAGVYAQLMPVFGAILAVLLLGERFGPHHLLGGGLVLAGILLARRRPVAAA